MQLNRRAREVRRGTPPFQRTSVSRQEGRARYFCSCLPGPISDQWLTLRSLYYKLVESCFSEKMFGGSSDLESHLPAEPPGAPSRRGRGPMSAGSPRGAGPHPEGTRGGGSGSESRRRRGDPGYPPEGWVQTAPFQPRSGAGSPSRLGVPRGGSGPKACRYLDHLRQFGCGREAALGASRWRILDYPMSWSPAMK